MAARPRSSPENPRGIRIGIVGCRTAYPPRVSPAVHIYEVWHRLQEMGYQVHSWGPQAVPGRIQHPRTDDGFIDLVARVDLLYVRFPFEYYWTPSMTARLLRGGNLPLILEFNAPLEEFTRDFPPRTLWTLRHKAALYGRNHLLARSCVDHAVCTCRELARYARDFFGLRKVSVLSDGGDPELFTPRLRAAGRARMGLESDDFAVFWGGITAFSWQGLNQIIAAADRMKEDTVKFVLVGDPAPLPGPLPPNVITLGSMDYFDLPRFMAASDAGLCIYGEHTWSPVGFYRSPLKLFDYMASGLPVIASNMGQIARVIKDGVNGYLVDGRSEDIVEKIMLLRQDPEKREAMGRAARQAVVERYNWQNVAERTHEIIQGLLRRSRTKRRRRAEAVT